MSSLCLTVFRPTVKYFENRAIYQRCSPINHFQFEKFTYFWEQRTQICTKTNTQILGYLIEISDIKGERNCRPTLLDAVIVVSLYAMLYIRARSFCMICTYILYNKNKLF